MLIDSHARHGFHVIRIMQDFEEDTDFGTLMAYVTEALDTGKTRIALSLGIKTYPYSKLISILINCNKLIESRGGKLAVIQPNKDFIDVLKKTKLDGIFIIVQSEDDLIKA